MFVKLTSMQRRVDNEEKSIAMSYSRPLHPTVAQCIPSSYSDLCSLIDSISLTVQLERAGFQLGIGSVQVRVVCLR